MGRARGPDLTSARVHACGPAVPRTRSRRERHAHPVQPARRLPIARDARGSACDGVPSASLGIRSPDLAAGDRAVPRGSDADSLRAAAGPRDRRIRAAPRLRLSRLTLGSMTELPTPRDDLAGLAAYRTQQPAADVCV